MIVKGNKSIREYKYLLAFDLASHNTGICLWDIKNNKPVDTFLMVTKKSDNFVYDLYNNLNIFFSDLKNKNIDLKDIFVCKEAMPSQLRGGNSTVQTFISLSKSHAILDLFLQQNNIDVYDYVGVYPATTHACIRKLLNIDSKTSVDKTTIKEYIKNEFGLETKTFDESDAAFLAVTLITNKWNKDLQEEMKEVKKHKKTLKANKAIADCDAKLEFLISLII